MSRDDRQIAPRTVVPYAVGGALLVGALYAYASPAVGVGAGFALGLLAVSQMLGEVLAKVARQQDNLYAQYECRTQLEQLLRPVEPLPTTRSYRGSPDFLLELYRRIMSHEPTVIVEGSSGLSTLVCGYALKQLGAGRVVSMEHDAHYARVSQDLVERHGLGGVARVHHAPIVRHEIRGRSWLWYDFGQADLPDEIDLIVIDGPPSNLQKKARYPALPLLIDRLKVGGILLLDDADRGGERRAVADWKAEFPNVEVEHVPLEKGLVVVRKTRPAAPRPRAATIRPPAP